MSKEEEKKEELAENDWGKKTTTAFEKELERLKQKYEKDVKSAKLYVRKLVVLGKQTKKSTISIMQFNVLADGLSGLYEPEDADKAFYAVPKASLNWDYRGVRLIEEVKRSKADIITFEEMDQYEYFKLHLGNEYDSLYLRNKKSACVRVGEKNNHKLLADGIAIFFSKDKFVCVEKKEFEGDKPVEVSALIVLLQDKASKRHVMVGGLHLKSAKDTAGEKIRLKQLARILPEAKQYQQDKEKELKATIPFFVGCDLNGPPIKSKEFEPFAYTSIVSRENLYKLIDSHNESAENEEEKLDISQYGYKENSWEVNLTSAYCEALKKEPDYTTWKKRKGGEDKHTIDYIFFQKSKGVSLLSYLDIPDEKSVNKETLLPGWEYPSDHFSIMVTFEY